MFSSGKIAARGLFMWERLLFCAYYQAAKIYLLVTFLSLGDSFLCKTTACYNNKLCES